MRMTLYDVVSLSEYFLKMLVIIRIQKFSANNGHKRKDERVGVDPVKTKNKDGNLFGGKRASKQSNERAIC